MRHRLAHRVGRSSQATPAAVDKSHPASHTEILTAPEPPVDLKALHAKIGQLALENDFLESALTKAGMLSARK
jgi:hypothetical protein